MGFWCVGLRGRRTPSGCLGLRDGAFPWCMGFCLCLQRGAALGLAQAGRSGRRQQFRWDVAEVEHGVSGHLPIAAQAEQVAISGALLGAVVPVDGAGLAQAGEAFLGTRAGAAPAMHAAAELASDGWGAAGAAGAGAGATARGEAEVGIAAAVFCDSGWRLDFGGHRLVPGAVFVLCSYTLPGGGEDTAFQLPPVGPVMPHRCLRRGS
jgi:hypothetical protein